MSPTVNVYSDASVKPGLSSWGAVIVRVGGEPFEASGPLKVTGDSSTHAELKAAANAISAGLKAGLIGVGDRVVIRCDNESACRRLAGHEFKGRKARNRRDFDDMIDWIREKAAEVGFAVTGRWIKGHQPASTECPHAKHNRRADQLCGRVSRTHAVRKSQARPPKATRLKQAAERAGDDRKARLAKVAEIAKAGELRT